MPSTPGSGLKDLIDDARRRHEDTRPEMLRALVKLYLQAPDHGPAEQARFATLARRLFDSVDIPVAAKHVREIAARTDLPRQLMLHLARGPLSVAGPVLRLSPVLTDDDLLELARTAPPDHRAAIGARRDVSPELAKRLAALLDDPQAAAGHMPSETVSGETVTGETAAGATLAVKDGPALHALPGGLMAPHADTAPEAGAAPTPRTAEPAASPIEADTAGMSAAATATPPAPPAPSPPREAAPARAEAPVPRTPEASPDLTFFNASPEERTTLLARLVTLPPLPLAERVNGGGDALTEALLDAAKADDKARLAGLLAEALDLAPATGRRIVADESGQALAVAARVLGLSLAILSRMLFRLHPATGRSAGEMTRLAEMFDSLPVGSAQNLVAQWRGARRVRSERVEDTQPIRSYAVARPAPLATGETEGQRERG